MNILITGGSSGLGKAVVEMLCQSEANRIYFTYKSNKESALAICEAHANAEAIQCDFSNNEDIENLLAHLPEWDLDALINNAWAGTPNGTYFHKTPAEDFLTAFQTNVMPLIQVTQACISLFRKKKSGKIINVMTSSLLDLPPMGFSVYTATKSYIHQLSKCWCKENQRFNITCNCVMPDYMRTSFSGIDERVVEQMQSEHPLKRLLVPEEAASVVAFLVNASAQVNGVSIPITAGQHVLL